VQETQEGGEAMKHGVRPSRKQKERLEAEGLNPSEWFVVKNCSDGFEVVHRETREIRKFGTRY